MSRIERKSWRLSSSPLAAVEAVAAAAAMVALLCAGGGAPVAEAQGQQDFSKVEVKAQLADGKVYMLTGSGGNIGALVGVRDWFGIFLITAILQKNSREAFVTPLDVPAEALRR